MSVIEAYIVPGSLKGGRTNTVQREYTVTWRCKVDDLFDNQVTVLASPLIPGDNVPFLGTNGSDIGARVTKRDARQSEISPYVWEVEITYSTQQADETQFLENPLIRPPKETYSTERYQRFGHEVPNFDYNANNAADSPTLAVLTSAKGRFEGGVGLETRRGVLTRVVNLNSFNFKTDVEDWIDRLNSSEWRGVPIGKAKIDDIRVEGPETENGFRFYVATYVIKVDRKWGWKLRLLDADTHHISGGVRKINRDTLTGQPFASPQLLDGSGGLLALGSQEKWREYDQFESKDFALNGRIG